MPKEHWFLQDVSLLPPFCGLARFTHEEFVLTHCSTSFGNCPICEKEERDSIKEKLKRCLGITASLSDEGVKMTKEMGGRMTKV